MRSSSAIPEQRRGPDEQRGQALLRVLALDPAPDHLRLTVLDGETVRFGHAIRDGHGRPCWPELQDLVLRYDPIDAVAIRFAHGGARRRPAVLDDAEIDDLSRLAERAPGDQERAVGLARMVREMLPDLPLVGCFDTALHRDLPEHVTRYPLPRPWSDHPALRRAGFGGLCCDYAQRRAAMLLRTPLHLLGMVVAQIGPEVGVTATSGGRSVDTSTGFSTSDGAVMATRSGSLDPGLLLWLARTSGLDVDALSSAFTERAGLAGLTGGTGDMRDVLAARAAGDQDAAVAVGVYLHRLRREIAAAAMALDSLDVLVLTGEIAESSAWLRSELVAGLGTLGVAIDHRRNREASHDTLLSEPGAPVAVLLIQAREDVALARGAAEVLAAGAPPQAEPSPADHLR